MDSEGADGEGLDEGAVGGDETDAGTAVEEVGDVGGALVGHPEDQLGQGDRDVGGGGGEQFLIGQPGRRAGRAKHQVGVGATVS